MNTPRLITDSDGNTVWKWDGEAFGNTPPTAETTGAGPFVFNLRFPGQYYDAETGLNQNYYRDYDPNTGRYIEFDPIGLHGGQLSSFVYVKNNPLRYSDRRGLLVPEAIVGGVIGSVFSVGAGLLSGDRGNSLWVDAGAGFATGFVIGLTDGASLLAAGGTADVLAVSGARSLFAGAVEADRQLINNCGNSVNWGGVAAASTGSLLGDWFGNKIKISNAINGEESLMAEQAN